MSKNPKEHKGRQIRERYRTILRLWRDVFRHAWPDARRMAREGLQLWLDHVQWCSSCGELITHRDYHYTTFLSGTLCAGCHNQYSE